MNDDILESLTRYRAEFEAGDRRALINAVSLCVNTGIPAPKWAVDAWNFCLVQYSSGITWSLDDAFGVHRAPGQHQKRFRKDQMDSLIWQLVVRRHKAGEPIKRELFEAVAEDLNERSDPVDGLHFNGTDVSEAYRRFKRIMGIK